MIPTVSILLPAWNAEATLEVALQSLLAQTFNDFEIVLLDDGSNDRTVSIAQGIPDPRIRIVQDGQRLGLARRLNQGIDLAQGKYIARMDADDLSFPERLAKQVAYLDAHPEIDLLGCKALAFRTGGEILGLMPFAGTHEVMCARPWRAIPLPHPGWMGRREWFGRYYYRVPEVRRAEDQEILLRSYPNSRFACLDDVLLGYRQGHFNVHKTLIARRDLLAAQVRCFAARHQWNYVAAATALTVLRVVVDCLAAFPGAERLYFMRISDQPPEEAVRTLQHCLAMHEISLP